MQYSEAVHRKWLTADNIKGGKVEFLNSGTSTSGVALPTCFQRAHANWHVINSGEKIISPLTSIFTIFKFRLTSSSELTNSVQVQFVMQSVS